METVEMQNIVNVEDATFNRTQDQGRFLRFSYTNMDGETSDRDILYLGYVDGHVHGLDLEHLNEDELEDVFNSANVRDEIVSRVPISNPQTFYDTVISNVSTESNAYRTFVEDRMSNIQTFEYNRS